MAQAYRCDRCQSYFTMNGFDNDMKYAKIKITEFNTPSKYRIVFSSICQYKSVDICPACYDDFINKFMTREAFVKDE